MVVGHMSVSNDAILALLSLLKVGSGYCPEFIEAAVRLRVDRDSSRADPCAVSIYCLLWRVSSWCPSVSSTSTYGAGRRMGGVGRLPRTAGVPVCLYHSTTQADQESLLARQAPL